MNSNFCYSFKISRIIKCSQKEIRTIYRYFENHKKALIWNAIVKLIRCNLYYSRGEFHLFINFQPEYTRFQLSAEFRACQRLTSMF